MSELQPGDERIHPDPDLELLRSALRIVRYWNTRYHGEAMDPAYRAVRCDVPVEVFDEMNAIRIQALAIEAWPGSTPWGG